MLHPLHRPPDEDWRPARRREQQEEEEGRQGRGDLLDGLTFKEMTHVACLLFSATVTRFGSQRGMANEWLRREEIGKWTQIPGIGQLR